MNLRNAIEEYTEIEKEIRRLEDKLEDQHNFIRSLSPLKIGTKVVRNRGVKKEKDEIFFISSITFDTDMKEITYGIKRNLDARIDTFSCISEKKLLKANAK